MCLSSFCLKFLLNGQSVLVQTVRESQLNGKLKFKLSFFFSLWLIFLCEYKSLCQGVISLCSLSFIPEGSCLRLFISSEFDWLLSTSISGNPLYHFPLMSAILLPLSLFFCALSMPVNSKRSSISVLDWHLDWAWY